MRTVRQPAVAGRFYASRAQRLERNVDDLLADARRRIAPPEISPKALLVPHAGYVYSGPTAACGYVLLDPVATAIRRVVLLGPAHYVPFSGLALPESDAFASPLGEVPLDRDTDARLLRLPHVIRSDHVHAPEHSLEVQLPFLQRVLADFTLVPLVVGDASPQDVAAVIEACWDGPETLLLISSDLSHYLPYAVADAKDADTVRQILALEWPLTDRSACGARGINGMLLAAREHGLHPALVDRSNSGDTSGDKSRVVGYAAISFTTPTHPGTTPGGDHDD